jgi:NosR/NirI family nitrous oxide reductase transcriptional regulator
MKQIALQLYRLAVVAVIAWLIRDLAVRQRTHGDSPIAVDEVKKLLPDAYSLRPDSTERDGLFVLDRQGRELGYVVRTQPYCRDILGYCGVTDALVVLGPDWKILGLTVHASDDTKEHVYDVVTDRRFLKKWNGMTWETAAGLDLKGAGIEGVSGATMTSMAIARSVKARLQLSSGGIAVRPPLQFGWRDWGLLTVLALAALMAFGRPAWRQRWRRPFQFGLIIYVGFISGDMVTQQLLAGWSRAGIPWSTAPGLVLLTVAALLVPWATRKPIYCHQLCPHGAAQEWIGKLRPARLHITLSGGVGRGTRVPPGRLVAARRRRGDDGCAA